MGIYSDYLEKIKENPDYRPIDVENLLSSNYRVATYKVIQEKIDEEKVKKKAAAKRKEKYIDKGLVDSYRELQALLSIYNLEDKIACDILNHKVVSTAWVWDMIRLCQENSNEGRRQVNELCDEIRQQLGKNAVPQINYAVSEVEVRSQLLKQLVDSVLRKLQNGSALDTSQFRNIIKDCAELIRYLQNERYAWADVKVFNDYIERQLGASRGSKSCSNCRGKLYKNIPYCTRCYERNV